MADSQEQNGSHIDDGLDLEIMAIIENRLRIDGFHLPTTNEVKRQYRALRNKHGKNLTADIADRELRSANTMANDKERILGALEGYLTEERGSTPDEQEVTDLYRRCEEQYGRPFHYRELERFLDDAAQLKGIRGYKPNWFDRTAETVRDFVVRLFHRQSSPDSK